MDKPALLDGLRLIAEVSDAKLCEYALAAINAIEQLEDIATDAIDDLTGIARGEWNCCLACAEGGELLGHSCGKFVSQQGGCANWIWWNERDKTDLCGDLCVNKERQEDDGC